jgi:hypothetical protein
MRSQRRLREERLKFRPDWLIFCAFEGDLPDATLLIPDNNHRRRRDQLSVHRAKIARPGR